MSGLPPDRDVAGVVFNIQRYSVHDGAGIRTLVFLKGCPLRCDWCSNPESQAAHPELAFNARRCLGVENCDYCADAYPQDVLRRPQAGPPVVARAALPRDAHRAAACPAQALFTYGERRTVREVLDAVERDTAFFTRSGGGLTLSGGEPLMQGDFALALLRESRRRRIDAGIETCGHVRWAVLRAACALVREVFFDVKSADSRLHKAWTGAGNRLILDNLARMLREFPDLSVTVRTPVVPGFNDSRAAIAAILDILAPFPEARYELLAYHRLGEEKFRFLGREAPMRGRALDAGRFNALRAYAAGRREPAAH